VWRRHTTEQTRDEGVRVLWQDGPGGAATCPEMGMLPTAGQGHVGRVLLLAGPRRVAGLAPLQGVRPASGRRRLARDVHDLGVDTV
jgi:hypothetical protein